MITATATLKPVKVFEITVTYQNVTVNTHYNGCEIAIRCETGLKARFVSRRERFSFMIDDVEVNSFDTTAACFVSELRQARMAAKLGKTVSVEVVAGQLYSEKTEPVMTYYTTGPHFFETSQSDAAKFVAQYIATGDETALLALSDYLEERLGLPIATAGKLADVVLAENEAAATRERCKGLRVSKQTYRQWSR